MSELEVSNRYPELAAVLSGSTAEQAQQQELQRLLEEAAQMGLLVTTT